LTLAKLRFSPKYLHLPKKSASKESTLHHKIKLNYSMTKVYKGYKNKEFNGNYKNIQKAAILFWNAGTSKP